MLQSSEWVSAFLMQDFPCIHSSQFLSSLFRFFLFPSLLQNAMSFTELAAPMNMSIAPSVTFQKEQRNTRGVCSGNPGQHPFRHRSLHWWSSHAEELLMFRLHAWSFFETTRGNPWQRKLISTVRFTVSFHLRVPFTCRFSFRTKLVARPGKFFLVSLFTNTNPCIIAFFPMLLPSEAPCSHAI